MKRRFAIVSIVAALAVPAHAESWAVYQDSVDGCLIDYPTNVFSQDALDVAKDFQRFSGPGEDTFFRVMGVDNEDNLGPEEIRTTYLKENAPGDVVYDRTKDDFLVLSGYRGDSIFYTRIAMSSDKRKLCIVEIAYPRAQKRAFDPIVTRMSRSFRAAK